MNQSLDVNACLATSVVLDPSRSKTRIPKSNLEDKDFVQLKLRVHVWLSYLLKDKLSRHEICYIDYDCETNLDY